MMKRNALSLSIVMVLAVGSVGTAQATSNLITNGDFSQIPTSASGITPEPITAENYQPWIPQVATSGCVLCAPLITWYPDLASSQTGSGALTGVTATPGGDSPFLAFNGVVPGDGLSQEILGLGAGVYTVAFDWAVSQLATHGLNTQNHFQISLGGQSFATPLITIPEHGFSGWQHASFTFDLTLPANYTLNFLPLSRLGDSPSPFPGMALLDNVSMVHAVPEPSGLATFGGGLLGLLAILALRRARRLDGIDAAGSDGNIG
jgi:hypothetical protein